MFPVFHCYALKEIGIELDKENILYAILPDIDSVINEGEGEDMFKVHYHNRDDINNEKLKQGLNLHLTLDFLAHYGYQNNGFLFRDKWKNMTRSKSHNLMEVYYDQVIAHKEKGLLEDIIDAVLNIDDEQIEAEIKLAKEISGLTNVFTKF